MGFFAKIFGLTKSNIGLPGIDPTEYKGYLIFPEPRSENGQYRIAGRITKEVEVEVEGELKDHAFIRSDLLSSKQDAETFMINKAKMFIDQTGDAMFK
ncbi:transcriptional regulator [Photobacterium damselae subsp. piscicida]|uniref:HlyU family transcriptional regulator n=1 Tax=Photobacterium damselae TaxID=38293 RepID=UPI0002E04E93|nr:HlyU family transcriptional regulator [Photobacterium damselae]OLQ79287.1 transcriptional regulator [Photobacterium damselae subsp. piscicida]TFZ54041.1 transcriptional regulator [Photobacterium damselae subsp. piscicida]TJZ91501.1 transcriptional regulator [Photobacterium damselae subsp. piscicida]